MAESSDYATPSSLSQSRSILISFISDNVKMAGGQVINMNGTKLRDIYSTSTMVSQLLDGVVLKVLGGAREDQKVQITNPGYIQALVQCYTDERFVEMLADHDSGKMKNRLQEEFLKIGIDVQGLKIIVENLEEVNMQRARMLKRHQYSTLAESSDYASMTSRFFSSSYGGSISISFTSDNVKMAGGQVINMSGTKLRDIYRTSTMVKQLLDGVILKVLGGVRDDQKVQITNPEYIQALVQCYTDERFVEMLADHDSGRMKYRLHKEFLKIGIDVQGLKIIVGNLDEVNMQRTRILNRSFINENIYQDVRNIGINENVQKKRAEEIKIDSMLASKLQILENRLSLHGEIHRDTAQSYNSIGVTQHKLKNYQAALESKQKALQIRLQLFGENHPDTAQSYYSIGATQKSLNDYKSALVSGKKALQIRLRLFGENHSDTADTYYSIGITQHDMKDYKSALESKQKALQIRLKLFGENHADTAQSFYNIAATQYSLNDYKSALESANKALQIRLTLFGENHADAARSYHNLGAMQHSVKDYKSALQSKQKSLQIRLALFGENHADTAQSYHDTGLTQYALKDYMSALKSVRKALHLALKLFGENHSDTAQYYHSTGLIQHESKDYQSAIGSYQLALQIRLKLFGEYHPDTAKTYRNIGVTQHTMKDYQSASQSYKHALQIRLKLFGENHRDTAESLQDTRLVHNDIKNCK